MALKFRYEGKPWYSWDEELSMHKAKAVAQAKKDLKKEIQRREALKDLVNARDVYLPQWRFALSPMDHPDIFHLPDSIAIYVDSIGDKPWIFDNRTYQPTPSIEDGNIEFVSVPDGSDEP